MNNKVNNDSKLNSFLLKIISLLAIIIVGHWGLMILINYSFPATNHVVINLIKYVSVMIGVIVLLAYTCHLALFLSLMPVKKRMWITVSALVFLVGELAVIGFVLRKALSTI